MISSTVVEDDLFLKQRQRDDKILFKTCFKPSSFRARAAFIFLKKQTIILFVAFGGVK